MPAEPISPNMLVGPGLLHFQHPGYLYYEASQCSTSIELLTKAYDHFKHARSGRMTLYLAGMIAKEHCAHGRWEMARKFFEKIGKTYRREKWWSILRVVVDWNYRCAVETKMWDKACECVVESLNEGKDALLDPFTEALTHFYQH